MESSGCRRWMFAVGVCMIFWGSPSQSRSDEVALPTYLLIGQSNMTGADSVATTELPGTSPLDRDVLFWNRSAWQGETWEDDSRFQPLRVQSTAGYCEDVIGPEFGFARALRARSENSKIAIVKVSFPASDLDSDWRPTTPSQGKACYAALTEEMTQVAKSLKADGFRPVVRAVLIHQGISDASSIEKAGRYEENLRRLIDRVRKDFASASTPVIVTRSNLSPMMPVDAMQAVRSSTVRVGETTTGVDWINVDDLERVVGHHFTAAGQMEIGKRFAQSLWKSKLRSTGSPLP
ncbi:MAG: sialate O-acetylesterase [Pirellulaceae bacterium]